MTEEEIIKILNDNIENCNAWLEDNDIEDIIWWKNQKQAIEGLLDLYKHEKEKNGILEDLLQGKLYELYLYYKDLAGSYQANSISKDKIIEFIDNVTNKGTYEIEGVKGSFELKEISVIRLREKLKELLEEE